jgi:hypothetical protein
VCHSYISPALSSTKNTLTTLIAAFAGGSIGNGMSTAISMSKIRNRTATTKNCIEKGTRIVELLRNPHSNALFLDVSVFLLFIIVFAIAANARSRSRLVICMEMNFMMLLYSCDRLEVDCRVDLLYS